MAINRRSKNLGDLAPLPQTRKEGNFTHSRSNGEPNWGESLMRSRSRLSPLPPESPALSMTKRKKASMQPLPPGLVVQSREEKVQALKEELKKLRLKLIGKGEEVARDNAEMSEQLALLDTRLAVGLDDNLSQGDV